LIRVQEIGELQEQLRDLMFHLEAEAKLKQQADQADQLTAADETPMVSGAEIRDSRLEVAQAPPTQPGKKNRRKNR